MKKTHEEKMSRPRRQIRLKDVEMKSSDNCECCGKNVDMPKFWTKKGVHISCTVCGPWFPDQFGDLSWLPSRSKWRVICNPSQDHPLFTKPVAFLESHVSGDEKGDIIEEEWEMSFLFSKEHKRSFRWLRDFVDSNDWVTTQSYGLLVTGMSGFEWLISNSPIDCIMRDDLFPIPMVSIYSEKNHYTERLCLHLEDKGPLGDTLLAYILALRNDEEAAKIIQQVEYAILNAIAGIAKHSSDDWDIELDEFGEEEDMFSDLLEEE